MTKDQLSKAFAIAKDFNIDLSNVDDTKLYGCGLPHYQPVYTTVEAVAKLLRWQCMQFNGEWNAEELNDIAHIGRKKFMVLGD